MQDYHLDSAISVIIWCNSNEPPTFPLSRLKKYKSEQIEERVSTDIDEIRYTLYNNTDMKA